VEIGKVPVFEVTSAALVQRCVSARGGGDCCSIIRIRSVIVVDAREKFESSKEAQQHRNNLIQDSWMNQ
jgi:hypothetical protein